MTVKVCKKCGQIKPFEDFYHATGMRDGHRNTCKACDIASHKAWYQQNRDEAISRVQQWRDENLDRYNAYQRERRQREDVKQRERAGHLKRKFGLTLEEYDQMLEAQGGGCAICGRPPNEKISLHVDHDHATGAVRGLLCFPCNQALAQLQESPDIVASALRYLMRYLPDRDYELAMLGVRARNRAG